MSSSAATTPEGPGSVSGVPHLPEGFTGTFTSRYVDTGDLRQHVVTGGDGPPLLLVHGWPQTWYAWRLVMPALARDFSVVAPDQRGTGLSGRPEGGYDTGTLAADLVALMDALGHRRFAVAGHDTGMWIGYALAADHPGRIDRLAVAETPLPGVVPVPAAVRQRAPEQRAMALRLQPARRSQRPARHRPGRDLLRLAVRHQGRQEAARVRRPLLRRHPHRSRSPARQLRDLPRAGCHHRAKPAAQGTPPDPARPGHRRPVQPGRTDRGHDEAGRRRRAGTGRPRLRPLGRRGNSGGNARRADRVPGPVPGLTGRGAQPPGCMMPRSSRSRP